MVGAPGTASVRAVSAPMPPGHTADVKGVVAAVGAMMVETSAMSAGDRESAGSKAHTCNKDTSLMHSACLQVRGQWMLR